MSAARDLLAEAKRLGASFRVEGDRIRVQAPAPVPAPLLEALRAHRDEVRALLAPWPARVLEALRAVPVPAGLDPGAWSDALDHLAGAELSAKAAAHVVGIDGRASIVLRPGGAYLWRDGGRESLRSVA